VRCEVRGRKYSKRGKRCDLRARLGGCRRREGVGKRRWAFNGESRCLNSPGLDGIWNRIALGMAFSEPSFLSRGGGGSNGVGDSR
jgi:hypothetical protein